MARPIFKPEIKPVWPGLRDIDNHGLYNRESIEELTRTQAIRRHIANYQSRISEWLEVFHWVEDTN
jgi:hypothetical protein